MLELYGHPFSSYTWKALIPLYANATPFDFRTVGGGASERDALVAAASPHGKFPVLVDGNRTVFETTTIIEYLDLHHPGMNRLIPDDPDAALAVRTMDRVFDHYVMNTAQIVVDEYIAHPDAPDPVRLATARARLRRSYVWLEQWLADDPAADGRITLVECAAAPALFYADWIEQIGEAFPRLSAWRAHLLAQPAIARCVDDARPYRSWFPPGAPDRD